MASTLHRALEDANVVALLDATHATAAQGSMSGMSELGDLLIAIVLAILGFPVLIIVLVHWSRARRKRLESQLPPL
jgi:Flp pilus assembly protein TadB